MSISLSKMQIGKEDQWNWRIWDSGLEGHKMWLRAELRSRSSHQQWVIVWLPKGQMAPAIPKQVLVKDNQWPVRVNCTEVTTVRAQKTSWGPDASHVIVQGHNHCTETPSWEREYKEGGRNPERQRNYPQVSVWNRKVTILSLGKFNPQREWELNNTRKFAKLKEVFLIFIAVFNIFVYLCKPLI